LQALFELFAQILAWHFIMTYGRKSW